MISRTRIGKEHIMNKKEMVRSLAVALIASITLSSVSLTSYALETDSPQSIDVNSHDASKNVKGNAQTLDIDSYTMSAKAIGTNIKSLHIPKSKNIWSYTSYQVIVNGSVISTKGFYMGDNFYIPFRAAATALGFSYSYSSATRTSVMSGKGVTLTATDGCYTVYSNGRPLFSLSPVVIMNDGRMYLPLDSFAKAIGMNVNTFGGSILLDGSIEPLVHANYFYDVDEVLWLARIIHAESSGEPLLGKISVGNVVLNRVKSSSYPNTIYGVIFDRKYGVQFSPVLNGTIYNTPSYESTLAAKICLEGFDISEGALFFLHPEISTSSWILTSRRYVFSIGKHDFYA